MPDEPWDHYDRGRLRRGFGYPVGRSVIEAALRAARVRVGRLDLRCPGAGPPDPVTPLLTAVIYGEIGATYHLRRGTDPGLRTGLTLHAVPGADRPAAAGLLTGGALTAAVTWLAGNADRAGSTWSGTSHEWEASLHRGRLLIAER